MQNQEKITEHILADHRNLQNFGKKSTPREMEHQKQLV